MGVITVLMAVMTCVLPSQGSTQVQVTRWDCCGLIAWDALCAGGWCFSACEAMLFLGQQHKPWVLVLCSPEGLCLSASSNSLPPPLFFFSIGVLRSVLGAHGFSGYFQLSARCSWWQKCHQVQNASPLCGQPCGIWLFLYSYRGAAFPWWSGADQSCWGQCEYAMWQEWLGSSATRFHPGFDQQSSPDASYWDAVSLPNIPNCVVLKLSSWADKFCLVFLSHAHAYPQPSLPECGSCSCAGLL